MLSPRLLNFLLNRKTRKKYIFIEIYDNAYLSMMKYGELLEYMNKIFSQINNNIKKLKWLYIKQKTESEPKVKEMRIDCDFLVYLQID
jgi:hypothetical protein